MQPGAGPAAEPPRQLTRAGGGTPPASRRLTCGKRRAASASARGPRPHSLTRSVSQTADAERNLPAVLRKLCARRDNHLFVGVAGVLRSTSPHLANAPTARISQILATSPPKVKWQASRVKACESSFPIPRLVGSNVENGSFSAKRLG